MGKAVIEIESLAKYYGKDRGIEDVSFSIDEGEVFGFIGPNGAGKSTTIRTLMALIRPSSGSAKIFGKDCIEYAPEIAHNIGYLAGESSFYERMRVREFLGYASELYGKKNNPRIKELSERLELDLNKRIENLSLGNKKKVGIVAAMLHSPKLLILDEPTSGLDPLVQQTFFEMLTEEKQRGVTILFSTHVLSEVQKICVRVAIIKEGKVIDIPSIYDLRRNGYKKVSLAIDGELNEELLNFHGVADLQIHDNEASFIYRGEVDELLERLGSLHLQDVFIQEPVLEEILLHYYR